jgi:hypothetical protein
MGKARTAGTLHARSLAPLVKTRDFGMTPSMEGCLAEADMERFADERLQAISYIPQ